MGNLHEFYLPLFTNSGKSYEEAIKAFEAKALALAGGFTWWPANGGWRNNDTGELQHEPVIIYRIACDGHTLGTLKAVLPRLFPDQAAFMVATVGRAQFIEGRGLREEPEDQVLSTRDVQ